MKRNKNIDNKLDKKDLNSVAGGIRSQDKILPPKKLPNTLNYSQLEKNKESDANALSSKFKRSIKILEKI